jgi:hypothetical protein
LPDAPISKVVVVMDGGAKGIFQNSTNSCKGTHRLDVSFVGHNGKSHDAAPRLKAQCGGGSHKRKRHSRR